MFVGFVVEVGEYFVVMFGGDVWVVVDYFDY